MNRDDQIGWLKIIGLTIVIVFKRGRSVIINYGIDHKTDYLVYLILEIGECSISFPSRICDGQPKGI